MARSNASLQRPVLRFLLALGTILNVSLLVPWLADPNRVASAPASDPTGLLNLVYGVLLPSSEVGSPIVWFYGLLTVGGFGASALAAALIIKSWHRRGVALLTGFLVWGTLFWTSVLLALPHGSPRWFSFWTEWPFAWVGTLGVSTLLGFALAALVTFARTFPRELSADDLTGALTPRQQAVLSGGWIRRVWWELPMWAVGATAVVVVWPDLKVPWSFLFYPSLCLGALFSVHELFGMGAVRATEEERRRLRWISGGVAGALWLWVAFGVLAGVLLFVGGDRGVAAYMAGVFVFGPLGMAIVMVVALGLAVLVEGAVDPGLAVNRTTVYGTLVLLFAFLFAVAEELVSGLLVDRVGVSDTAASVLLGAVVALVVAPLKSMVDRGVLVWLPAEDDDDPEGVTSS